MIQSRIGKIGGRWRIEGASLRIIGKSLFNFCEKSFPLIKAQGPRPCIVQGLVLNVAHRITAHQLIGPPSLPLFEHFRWLVCSAPSQLFWQPLRSGYEVSGLSPEVLHAAWRSSCLGASLLKMTTKDRRAYVVWFLAHDANGKPCSLLEVCVVTVCFQEAQLSLRGSWLGSYCELYRADGMNISLSGHPRY